MYSEKQLVDWPIFLNDKKKYIRDYIAKKNRELLTHFTTGKIIFPDGPFVEGFTILPGKSATIQNYLFKWCT